MLQAEAREQDQLQQAVLGLHEQLLVFLTAADFRLGKAYGLGRALAETARLPDAEEPASFQRAFGRYRLANILSWLADLKSAFPPHAAEAVRGSLEAWEGWAEAPTLLPASNDRRAPEAVDWQSTPDRQSVMRALHRQGELWRAILSGEKDCLDFLSTDDYLRAADQLLGRIRHLTLRFVRHFWITTALTAVILVGAIVTVFLVHATSTVVAVVVAGAGAVGVTWKGAASSLGRVLAQAQRPLWESELDAVVAGAVTLLPRRRRSADRPADPNGADQEPEVVAADAGDLEELHG